MKNSRIDWLGAIPDAWEVVPMRQFFVERKNKNVAARERNLLSLSYGRIIRKDANATEGLLPDNFLGYNIVEQGDIVFRLTDLQNDKRSLRSGLVPERGIITSAYVTVRPREGVESRFFNYMFRAYDQLKVFYNIGGGVRQGANFDDLKRLPCAVPAFFEQQSIADYLDAHCREIDEVEQALASEIEALQRLRKVTIHKAVTKGLDDGVSMKDSGMAWIGAVPSNWELPRFKTVYKHVRRVGYENEELLSVYLNHGVIRFSDDDGVRVHKTSSDMSGYQLVVPGQLVMNNQQAWRGSVGVSSLRGIVSPAYHVYESTNDDVLDNTYANYMFRSCMVPAYELCSHGVGTIQRNISPDEFGYERFPLPPLFEQHRIADYLDERCAAIDSVIATRTQQLERLKDYRKALIFAYVTGKKEVPAYE